MVEYVIWGTKDGSEDIIKINGEETQISLAKTKKYVKILKKKGDFSKIRIQKIDLQNYNIKSDFTRGIK